ncbi:MAG TPA: hypothetical protein VE999_14350 [Gemmataceae bacterium]|nr:hypothetical protein [Gemmataceae bacterium]
MDTEILVENKINDGHRLLARLVRKGFDVDAAYLLKTADDDRWMLYIMSNNVDKGSSADAYRDVYSELHAMDDSWLSMSEIKLLSPRHPLNTILPGIFGKHSGRFPSSRNPYVVRDLEIVDAYIYPPQKGHMTREELLQAIANYINRSGSMQSARITFKDGSTITALPVGIDVVHPGKVRIRFRVVGNFMDVTHDADDISRID